MMRTQQNIRLIHHGPKFRFIAALLVIVMLLASVPAFAANEEPAEYVTVYFTLSVDGIPVVGYDPDQTILTRVPVKVPYFDLAAYDLEDFYRYPANSFEDGGEYISTNVIERPTVLHLFIFALEKYFLGYDIDDFPSMEASFWKDTNSYIDREGNEHNSNYDCAALTISGSATHLYMTNFWGHDENLMYYVDHQYPLQAAGWGSTCDYILLEDGMSIDVAMFTNWSFWTYGAFAFFDRDEYYVEAGVENTYTVYKTETVAAQDGSSYISTPLNGLVVKVSDEYGWAGSELGTTDENGKLSFTFDEPGTYTITAEDPNEGTSDACFAPATATVHVMDEVPALEGITLNLHEATLDPAEPLTLKATTTPENVPGVTYTWESSDPEVAYVSEIGVIKTFKDNTTGGTVTVTCTATDTLGNTFTDSCEVTVGGATPVTGISFDTEDLELEVGETDTLKAIVTPEDASQQTVQWRTSEQPDWNTNPTDAGYTILKVDSFGNLTARSKGVVTVYAKTDDGGYIASCRVAVGLKFGDVNEDGVIDNKDVVLVRREILGSNTVEINKELADYDNNGVIDNKDVIFIKFLAMN